MNIRQFGYSTDNFSYLVHGTSTALAIDPGAVAEMTAFAADRGITIACVTNTHSHHDHTSGNRQILEKTGARFLDFNALVSQGSIELNQESIKVYHTPGHTMDCLTFHVHDMLITGDTLFNGTIGNCFSGDMTSFFKSIQFLMSLDPDSVVYAGHDYVKEAMTYARIIEPGNPDIDRYLAGYNRDHVYSTLADEFKVNPYLRFNVPHMVEKMNRQGFETRTPLDRFISMYELG